VQFITTTFDVKREREEKERQREGEGERERERELRILIFSIYVYEYVNIISFDGGTDALILENIFSVASRRLHEIYVIAECSHFSMSISILITISISYY